MGSLLSAFVVSKEEGRRGEVSVQHADRQSSCLLLSPPFFFVILSSQKTRKTVVYPHMCVVLISQLL
jgi:hypothetical protein